MSIQSSRDHASRGAVLSEVIVGLALSCLLLALTADLWQAANRDLEVVSHYNQQAARSHRRNLLAPEAQLSRTQVYVAKPAADPLVRRKASASGAAQ